MSFLFSRSRQKSPQELVRTLAELLTRAENSLDRRKGVEDINRCLYQMRFVLCGDFETDPVPDQIAQLAQEVYSSDVLVQLVGNLHILEFDSRKDVVTIFTTLLRRQIGSRSPTVDYLATRPTIFDSLISWSASPDLALTAGAIVRECIKYDTLASIIVNSPMFWNYFEYMTTGTFEITTDSFTTFISLFSLHPAVVSDFLTRNSGPFAIKMNGLMRTDNYVIKRQSLKLMAQIIRQRSNFQFMGEYIRDPENLKQVMNMLRDKSPNVQYEAFHVFKVFAANPKKSKPISDILIKNRSKLLNFLTNFSPEKKDDDAFKDEKAFIIKQIQNLPQAQPQPSSHSQTPHSQSPHAQALAPDHQKIGPPSHIQLPAPSASVAGPSILSPGHSTPAAVVQDATTYENRISNLPSPQLPS